MNRKFIFSIAILLLVNLAYAVHAASNLNSFPQPNDLYVNDFAHILDASQAEHLRAVFSEVNSKTGAQIVFASINSSAPMTPVEYRTALFNNWHIGQQGKDNGLLILYSVQEKRIEVETGYGLEGILPDSKIGRILDDFYVPLRDAGHTDLGIVNASENIASIIETDSGTSAATADSRINAFSFNTSSIAVLVIIAVIIISVLFYIIKISMNVSQAKKKKQKKPYFRIILFILWFFLTISFIFSGFSALAIISIFVIFIIIKSLSSGFRRIGTPFFFPGSGMSGGFGGGFSGFGGGMSGGGGAGR